MRKNETENAFSLPYNLIRKIAVDRDAIIHFIGVGGVSMYSLAVLTMSFGAKVSGSDREDSPRVQSLRQSGADVQIGHSRDNPSRANLVVYSHAIAKDNPELLYAIENNIPTVSRAEFLGAMMLGYSSRIGISGSHGKSTTVAMLDAIFTHANALPTTLSGSDLPIGSPVRLGSDGVMIYEACEYKDSFLRFSPTISVGLNLELDHTDYFDSVDSLRKSFTKALGKAEHFALINGDDGNLTLIKNQIKAPIITFGGGENNDYRYSITTFREDGFDFTISRFGNIIGNFSLNIPGVFNVHNAAAAIVVALEYGIDIQIIAEAIGSFRGISGRLEYIGRRYGRPVYYDYAHHPTEILASINALRSFVRQPLSVVFKPHTYSRTKSLWNDFRSSLSAADYLIITDIFPARESPIPEISSDRLASAINGAVYCTDEEICSYLDMSTKGAIVLMGAGSYEKIKKFILTE